MAKKFRRKQLTCGCCGAYFHTWPEYIDQDQDKGYGTCRKCQEMIMAKNNAQLDDLRVKIRDCLSEKNRTKWDGYDLETQRLLAMKCIDDGMVTFSFSHTKIMEQNLPGARNEN